MRTLFLTGMALAVALSVQAGNSISPRPTVPIGADMTRAELLKRYKTARQANAPALKAPYEEIPTDATPVYDNPFKALVEGSEEAPVAITLDAEGNIPADLIGEACYGFGGAALYQADGAEYIKYGEGDIDSDDDYIIGRGWMPWLPGGKAYQVNLEAKAVGQSANDLELYALTDSYGLLGEWHSEALTGEWKQFTFHFDASQEPDIWFQISYFPAEDDRLNLRVPTAGDIMIRNVVVAEMRGPLAPPVALTYSDYTGTSFRAHWRAPEGAEGFNLYVAEYDDEAYAPVEPYLIDGLDVGSATSYTVEGITPGKVYVYWLTSYADDEVSGKSNTERVAALPLVGDLTGEAREDLSGYDLTWTGPEGANRYEVVIKRIFNAEEEQELVLADIDFSFIESEGTVENPLPAEYQYMDYPEALGWFIADAIEADGAAGITYNPETFAWGGYDYIQSPMWDLSDCAEPVMNISVEAASGKNATMMAWTIDDAYKHGIAWVAPEPMTPDYRTTTFTLDIEPGLTGFQLMQTPYVDDQGIMDGNMLVKRITVSFPIKTGGHMTEDYLGHSLEATSYYLEVPVEETYSYLVSVVAEQTERIEYAEGQYYTDIKFKSLPATIVVSAPEKEDSILAPETDDNAETVYYTLQGRRLTAPAPGQILIRVSSGRATKVIL